MAENFAQQAIVSMVVHLFFFALTWWSLMGFKIDVHLKAGKTIQARVLLILITIAIGSSVANFFLNYLSWSRQLQYLL